MYSVLAGDGDGLIGVAGSSYTMNGEVADFWPSLSLIGFKAEENSVSGYSAAAAYGYGTFPFGVPNAPKSKIGTDAGILAGGSSSPAVFSTSNLYGDINFYWIANCTG